MAGRPESGECAFAACLSEGRVCNWGCPNKYKYLAQLLKHFATLCNIRSNPVSLTLANIRLLLLLVLHTCLTAHFYFTAIRRYEEKVASMDFLVYFSESIVCYLLYFFGALVIVLFVIIYLLYDSYYVLEQTNGVCNELRQTYETLQKDLEQARGDRTLYMENCDKLKEELQQERDATKRIQTTRTKKLNVLQRKYEADVETLKDTLEQVRRNCSLNINTRGSLEETLKQERLASSQARMAHENDFTTLRELHEAEKKDLNDKLRSLQHNSDSCRAQWLKEKKQTKVLIEGLEKRLVAGDRHAANLSQLLIAKQAELRSVHTELEASKKCAMMWQEMAKSTQNDLASAASAETIAVRRTVLNA